MWQKAERTLLKDKYIGPLIKKYGSCKIKPSKKENYFIDLVESIVSQQLSGKAASTIFKRFKDGLKEEIDPKNILKTKDSKFRSWGLSGQKTKYIKDLALKVKEGGVEIYKLDKLPNEKVIEELVKVKGIGRWTAEMFLMFSLSREDVFPVDDLGIRKGFAKVVGKALEKEKLAKFSDIWKPYRTVASWYLWKSLEPG